MSQSVGLFTLPREIRDEIYAALFHDEPYLAIDFNGIPMHLHYGPRCCSIYPSSKRKSWLLTSKTFMAEAFEEYARKAIFIWHGPYITSYRPIPTLPIVDLQKDVKSMALYVGNLAHWETPYHNEGEDGREGIRMIADTLRKFGTKIDLIRLQGHSYRYWQSQKDFMLKNLRKVFDGVEVRNWEFEVLSGNSGAHKWSVGFFDVGPEGELNLAADREHSEFCQRWTAEKREEERKQRERMRVYRAQHMERARERKRIKEQKEAQRALEEASSVGQGGSQQQEQEREEDTSVAASSGS